MLIFIPVLFWLTELGNPSLPQGEEEQFVLLKGELFNSISKLVKEFTKFDKLNPLELFLFFFNEFFLYMEKCFSVLGNIKKVFAFFKWFIVVYLLYIILFGLLSLLICSLLLLL